MAVRMEATRGRRAAAQARQVALYLAAIGLSWPLERVGSAFGRAKSTVAHACTQVEELRDQSGFDKRLTRCEQWLQQGLALLEVHHDPR